MTRLALTLPCRDHETPYSYVSRLAALNGSNVAEDFVADIGVSWQAIWDGDEEAIRKMADLASQSPDALLKSNINRVSVKMLTLGGEVFRGRNLLRTNLRVCPLCLREDRREHGVFGPYFRAHWALSHYRVCACHNALLLPVPSGADRRSPMDSWGRIADQWAYIDDNAGTSDNKLEAEFSQYLIGRLERKSASQWLDQIPLELAGQFCEILGLALRYGGQRSSASCDPEELAIATEEGFRAVTGGPSSIWGALTVARQNSAKKGSTFSSDFGNLYTWLKKFEFDDPECAPILDAVAEFSFQEYSFAKGDWFLGRVCNKRHNFCPNSLAHEYGLDIVVARKILRGLQDQFTPYRTPIVRADHLVPVVERFCRSLLSHEAEATLGVDRAVLARLVDNNILTEPLRIHGCNERFDPHDLSKFEENLFARSKLVGVSSLGFAPMRELRTAYSLRLDVMCKWVLSGHVKKVEHCRDAASFQDIALNAEEVRSKLAQSRQPNYSKTELKSILCVNDTTVAYLVREKLIFGEEQKNSFNNKVEHRFWPKGIDGFLEKYVPLGLFAKTLFLQPFAAKQRLAKIGILPVEVPSKCNRIFLRKDLTDELRRVPLDWRSLVGEPSLP